MSGPVHVGNSNTSFREALSACPGALGAVSFALGHLRVTSPGGVFIDETLPDENGVIRVIFQDARHNEIARANINQRQRAVYGNNVRSAMRRRVACIMP